MPHEANKALNSSAEGGVGERVDVVGCTPIAPADEQLRTYDV
jgi:hypothetical protein